MAAQKLQLTKILVIDGHNLIPKIAGMSLEDLNDEERLIERLNAYASRRRKQINVFFDNAAPGHGGASTRGLIRAYFVLRPLIADEAIRRYVKSLGPAAKNVTVISSDHRVQTEVKSLGAQVVSSDAFAAEMESAAAEQSTPGSQPPANVDDWLGVFGIDEQQAEQPIPLGKKKTGPLKKPAPVKPGGKKPVEKKRPHHGFKPKGR